VSKVTDSSHELHQRRLDAMDWDAETQSTQTCAAFNRDEIVRAIEAVTKAGLTVHSVEITTSGSIKIETEPRKQRPSTPTTAPFSANGQDETSKRKQV